MKRPLDTLLAIKVLEFVPGLNGNARRVGAVLLEHYNRQTGRCDPGINRIAELLGINTRTVMRCNLQLERAGLFRKVRHGGYGNRNHYEPAWSRFAEHQVAWQAKIQQKSKSQATKLSPLTRQDCHVGGVSTVTQTCITNSNPPTYSGGRSRRDVDGRGGARTATVIGKNNADAARDEAERRWARELDDRFRLLPVTYAEVIDAITDEIRSAATGAELQRRGAGIGYIVQRLKLG